MKNKYRAVRGVGAPEGSTELFRYTWGISMNRKKIITLHFIRCSLYISFHSTFLRALNINQPSFFGNFQCWHTWFENTSRHA
jgi:hypothetical protein